jgi:hypothetical protein
MLYDYNVQEKVDLFVQYAHNQVGLLYQLCCQIADSPSSNINVVCTQRSIRSSKG